jgi:hypothetical protein
VGGCNIASCTHCLSLLNCVHRGRPLLVSATVSGICALVLIKLGSKSTTSLAKGASLSGGYPIDKPGAKEWESKLVGDVNFQLPP